jgi:hypothetical protein
MNKKIDNIRKTRSYLLNLIEGLSDEQLNKVPGGFQNNIIWNLGHLIAAQQGVGYIRGGVQPAVEESFLALYRPGTKPERTFDSTEIAQVKERLLTSLDQFEADYQNRQFDNYTPWTTRYGVALASIEDAIDFLAYHEGLHAGVIMAIKKLV